jgi:phosphoribosylformimino-5-aminoimidazole carboxamide ribotide isomerase
VNLDETRRLAQSVNIPIIASGGVATLDDIHKLLALQKEGVEGVIIGKALYAGAFTLREATSVVGEKVSGFEG